MNQRHLQIRGAAIGLTAAVLVVLLQAGGFLDSLENLSLDLRQLYCNRLDVIPSIVHVDIDDGALERVGRWPDAWPRDLMAELLRVISAAGARTIAVDLLFGEPAPARVDLPGTALDPGGIEGDIASAAAASSGGGDDASRVVVPDLELAAALAESGRVILSVQAVRDDGATRRDESADGLQLQGERPGGSAGGGEPRHERLGSPRHERRSELREKPGDESGDERRDERRDEPRGGDAARAALRRIISEEFAVSGAELEQRWNAARAALPADAAAVPLDRMLAGVKREVAESLVSAALRQKPAVRRLDELYQALRLNPADVAARDRADLVAALSHALGRQALLEHQPRVPDALRGARGVVAIPQAETPYYPLAQAAHGFGVVNVRKDSDGVVRRLTPLFDFDGHLVPHLGLAVAADQLGFDIAGAVAVGGALQFSLPSGGVLRVPLDRRGKVLLHWSPDDLRWPTSPRHISAARLIQVVSSLSAMRQNVQQQALRLAKAIETANPPTVKNGRAVPTRLVVAALSRIAAWRDAAMASATAQSILATGPEAASGAAAATAASSAAAACRLALPAELQASRRSAERDLRELLAAFRDQPPRDAAEQADLDACRRVINPEKGVDLFADIDRLAAANDHMLAETGDILRDLRARMSGNIVFVGHTATAQGDVIPTAVDSSLPGVIAHATLVNTFLRGARFLHMPPRWVELGLTLLLGGLTTLVTAGRGIRVTLAFALSLTAGFLALNAWVLFRGLEWYVQLVPPLLAVVATAMPVTFYRWWTTDRQRREIRVQFAQYTSPALANRIADDPAAMQFLTRVESREITCFFSDLKGFTTLAEQTAPDHVRRVLNIYLDRMSEVLDRRRALINKFMGDGIFAFFNSTVLPQEDHPRNACEATLECLEALRLLRENPPGGPDEIISQLEMRVGLASGMAGVGDFGSSRKKDYTVIGDVANLAARLEPANKVFGTRAMVSGPTRDAVIEFYEFRYLADLQVKGKNLTAPVFELMGRKGEVSADDMAWAERFAIGVELFRQRLWDDCIRHFTRMLARRFDDAGASAYITACEEKKAFPPDDDWNGAFELKEK